MTRPVLNAAHRALIPKTFFRIGKLVVFAAVEPGGRVEFCTAGLAVRMARRQQCLAVDLDSETGILRKYLPLHVTDRKMPAFFQDRVSSLDALKTKARIANIEFIEWTALPEIQTFLRLLDSDAAGYVLAALGPGAARKGVNLFCAADISIVVTRPGAAALEKVFAFLAQVAARGSSAVYILTNRIMTGAEEREISAWMESSEQTLGIKIGFIGTVTYDARSEPGIHLVHPISGLGPQGSSGSAFEDIALKIERLLPRNRFQASNGAGSSGLSGAFSWLFGRKMKRLQEQIRQRDEFISRLQQEHAPPEELAALAARISELESDAAARQKENDRLKESLRSVESYHREIADLGERLHDSQEMSRRLEKTLTIVEEANSRLKFELMSAVETKTARPAPHALLRARTTLLDILRPEPPQSITIVSSESAGSATFDFSIEMRSILESAGWTVKFMEGSFDGGQFYGLQVINDRSEPSAAAARILCRALDSAGFAFFERIAPALANMTPLRLLVGRNNWR